MIIVFNRNILGTHIRPKNMSISMKHFVLSFFSPICTCSVSALTNAYPGREFVPCTKLWGWDGPGFPNFRLR